MTACNVSLTIIEVLDTSQNFETCGQRDRDCAYAEYHPKNTNIYLPFSSVKQNIHSLRSLATKPKPKTKTTNS